MDLKKLFNDDDAVSPVIGVILMVAITVILAAVIASFVLGLGDQAQETTPQASFNFDYSAADGTDDGTVQVTHDGGDSIGPARLSLVGSENIEASASSTGNGDDTLELDAAGDDGYGLSDDVSAGTSVTVYEPGSTTGTTEFNDLTLRVVFNSESGDSSATLAEWEGPGA